MLPEMKGGPSDDASRTLGRRLTRVESRNVTFTSDPFPIFWERAEGSNVWDADGNRYVDLTAGFGVAAAGHRHPRIVAAIRDQADRLLHGLGDVHPPRVKVELLERLAELAPIPDPRIVLGTSGSEAVEIALKTAALATGRPGVLCFGGAYHGLTYGALSVTDRAHFRGPFEGQLNPHVRRVPFPHPYRPPPELGSGSAAPELLVRRALDRVERELDAAEDPPGAVIVEPIQGRGGEVVPPPGFLAGVAELCRARDVLLAVDEVYTGLGRTGVRFACLAEGVTPDLLCVGKALSGSVPVSACIGRRQVMDAWPPSAGEAIHTSTFLGNPLACAAALASLSVIEEEKLAARAGEEGLRWRQELREVAVRHPRLGDVRGRGLAVGLDLVRDPERRAPDPALAERVLAAALRRGWILLAGGPHGNVLSLSPPLNVERETLSAFTAVLEELLTSETGEALP